MARFRALAVLVVAPWLVGGCSPGPEPPPAIPYFDLVARVESAQVERETGVVPFGQPQARPYLVDGWSGDETDRRRERRFIWSDGPESVIRFRLLAARDLEVAFEARPYLQEEKPDQVVTVVVNDSPAGQVTLRRGLNRYTLGVPADLLVAGENLLAFRYLHVREPSGPEDDRRRLAVAWYGLELGGSAPEAPEPQASAERQSLFLPYGSQLAYLVRLEPESELRCRRLAFRGSGGRLEVWLETDAEAPRQIALLAEGAGEVAAPVPVPLATPARLVLRAQTESPGGAEDGVVLDAPALWSTDPARQAAAWRPSAATAGNRPRPDIFIYLVDALRFDRLGVYGYDKPTSPELDAFAEQAVVFENTVGQSSWTRASVASLFTGLWPHTHGAIGRRDRLSPEAATLAESLQAGGYHTVAFATNPNIDERFGFSQGFDEYIHVRRGTDSPRLTGRVLAWLDQWQGDKPLFLYIHAVDPHDPYTPPPEFVERFAPDSKEFLRQIVTQRRRESWDPTEENLRHLNQLYDAEVAANDASFGYLLDELRRRGLYEDSLIAFISDHGEEFYDHGGFTHGKNLFVETLNVPFLLRFPGQREPRRVEAPAQHIDLMPTVLDYLGLPIPEAVEGRSLAAVADPEFREPEAATGRVYSHLELDGSLTLSVVDGDWKLIDWRGRRRSRKILFNSRLDPAETQDLSEQYPIRTAVMAALLEDKLQGNVNRLSREEAELDEELERSLRALGYLQ